MLSGRILKAATQREVEIRPLGELLALNSKQSQPGGIHAQLLLLDRTQIYLADAVTRLRQFQCALVVSYGPLEKLVAFGQSVSGGEGFSTSPSARNARRAY